MHLYLIYDALYKQKYTNALLCMYTYSWGYGPSIDMEIVSQVSLWSQLGVAEISS